MMLGVMNLGGGSEENNKTLSNNDKKAFVEELSKMTQIELDKRTVAVTKFNAM
jgi:hypothetical protein